MLKRLSMRPDVRRIALIEIPGGGEAKKAFVIRRGIVAGRLEPVLRAVVADPSNLDGRDESSCVSTRRTFRRF